MKIVKYNESCSLDIYEPTNPNGKVIVFFHGGGLVSGSTRDVRANGEDFCELGYVFVAPQYRFLNKDNPDECAYFSDCAEAIKYVFDSYSNHKIYVGGHSAGGYLSMMLCFDEKILCKVGLRPGDIEGYFFMSGQPTTHFNYLQYKGLDPRRVIVDEYSPLFHVNGNVVDSNIFIISAENDMTNRPIQNELLYKTMLHFGYDRKRIEYICLPAEDHCSYADKRYAKDGQYAVTIINDFILRHE